MDQIKIPHNPRHLGVPSVVSKTISKRTVHSLQTMHLSCVKISIISKWTISIISKWTEMRFHMTPVT
jgi:hypothetical protein